MGRFPSRLARSKYKNNMIGLILAAGLGTRLTSETKDKPKCMVTVGNKPVLERIADHMNKHGIWRIVVNLHAFPEVVMKHFGQRFLYLYEPAPMGEFATVEIIRAMFPGEPVVTMNGDTITDINLTELLIPHVNTRYFSNKTHRHMGTSVYVKGPMDRSGRKDVDCEYFDIGTPAGLVEARKRYV